MAKQYLAVNKRRGGGNFAVPSCFVGYAGIFGEGALAFFYDNDMRLDAKYLFADIPVKSAHYRQCDDKRSYSQGYPANCDQRRKEREYSSPSRF
jgi:hypothetical protein